MSNPGDVCIIAEERQGRRASSADHRSWRNPTRPSRQTGLDRLNRDTRHSDVARQAGSGLQRQTLADISDDARASPPTDDASALLCLATLWQCPTCIACIGLLNRCPNVQSPPPRICTGRRHRAPRHGRRFFLVDRSPARRAARAPRLCLPIYAAGPPWGSTSTNTSTSSTGRRTGLAPSASSSLAAAAGRHHHRSPPSRLHRRDGLSRLCARRRPGRHHHRDACVFGFDSYFGNQIEGRRVELISLAPLSHNNNPTN